jgi:aminomethyltransferase
VTAERRTPLFDEHVAAGARMVPFAGWSMPVQYKGIVAEHKAVREAAGLFDVSHMGEVELRGAAVREACALLFTNDIHRLEPGKARYTLIANETGGMVDDVIVYCLAEERFLVCVNAANAAKDVAWIQRHVGSLVEVDDRSDATALLALQGPRAAAILGRLDGRASGVGRFGVATLAPGGIELLAARTGYTGEDGFELFVAAGQAAELWRLLLREGEADGLVPAGLGARDTLRLEAALPLYGHELGEEVSPFEARVGWAVKLDRPQMIGYAALAAARDRGRRRRLVGLLPEGGIAREGAEVFAPGGGAAVGLVTSGSHAPSLGRAVALASVDEAFRGEAVEIELRGQRRAASVTALPFYVRQAP